MLENGINQLIKDYLSHLATTASVNTVRNYKHAIREFYYFISLNHLAVSEDTVNEKFQSYLRSKNYSGVTTYTYLLALKSYFKFLESKGAHLVDPEKFNLYAIIDATREYRHHYHGDLLTRGELKKLIEYWASQPSFLDTLQSIRNQIIIELFASTGVTVTELVNIRIEDVDIVNKKILVRNRLERFDHKARKITINDSLVYWIQKYLGMRHDRSPFLMAGFRQKGTTELQSEKLTTRSVERMIKQTSDLCGIKKNVTPMVFRHTRVAYLYKNGVSHEKISKSMGYTYTSHSPRRITERVGREYKPLYNKRKVIAKNESSSE